jgi:hypothetical protein
VCAPRGGAQQKQPARVWLRKGQERGAGLRGLFGMLAKDVRLTRILHVVIPVLAGMTGKRFNLPGD